MLTTASPATTTASSSSTPTPSTSDWWTREIGVLTYNRELRLWEMTLSNQKAPIRLKRNVGSDALLSLNNQLVRVSQKHIINLGYLMEVTNNTCRFYPPFDKVEDVKVGRLFRKKLIDQFCNL